jgi:hypothetical protein
MKLNEITVLLQQATASGTQKVLQKAAIVKISYSKSEAYKLYGRLNVDRWLSEQLLQINNKKIDRLKLEAVAAKSNRHTYLPVANR